MHFNDIKFGMGFLWTGKKERDLANATFSRYFISCVLLSGGFREQLRAWRGSSSKGPRQNGNRNGTGQVCINATDLGATNFWSRLNSSHPNQGVPEGTFVVFLSHSRQVPERDPETGNCHLPIQYLATVYSKPSYYAINSFREIIA